MKDNSCTVTTKNLIPLISRETNPQEEGMNKNDCVEAINEFQDGVCYTKEIK
jgi:hypothetical protein